MFDNKEAFWINEPKEYEISKDSIVIKTEPNTDLWQRTFYGFRHDNAPAYMIKTSDNFTFTTKVDFKYKSQFDQCGLVIYLNSDNWFKVSLEYECEQYSYLGGVVTNNGYSDWSTSEIENKNTIWFRLSRRGPDFLMEYSIDGKKYSQMRIFHLHLLGETTEEMGAANPPLKPKKEISFGISACSPLDTSFKAEFTNMKLENCIWKSHN